MQEQPFRAWLRDVRKQVDGSIATRVADCSLVERHEGELDAHWHADGLRGLLDRLTYSREDERNGRSPEHNVPTKGDLYNNSATFKAAVNLYRKFLDARGDEGAEGSVAHCERWDRYLEDVRRYVESDLLDSQEIDYKLAIELQLQEARRAVLEGDENCLALVTKAINNNLTSTYDKIGLRNWFRDQPKEAQEALRVIWADEKGLSGADRIRAFTRLIPDSLQSGTGTRLRWISVLLMACGARRFPPYKVTEFNKTYERTGHSGPAAGGDEASHYETALGFLDQLLERARGAGMERPKDRLEAQSVAWAVAYERPVQPKHRLADADVTELASNLLYDAADLQRIAKLLDDKRQVIFQGPPGTGKTYAARKLARHLSGSDERVTLVQFHPSYAYEDFVQGYRPTLTAAGQAGFTLRDGPLVTAAAAARDEPDAPHFLIIDEINRGNLAKVFGELYFLLEYRNAHMTLQYASAEDEKFSLPKNLYIIGTMNTADRSIALVDLALRRRFHFVEFHPDKPPVEGLLGRWLERHAPDMKSVEDVVRRANEKLHDRQAAIGPSYFMREGLDEDKVRLIWEHNVVPYIEEHLYGETDRLDEFKLDRLRRQGTGDNADEDASDESTEPADDDQN